MQTENSVITLTVEISDIIYQNESNGYTVFEFETEDALETGTGIIPGLFVGEQLKMSGQWTKHQTYGKQFKVLSFEKTVPSDSATMLKYLASGAIKGIGPKTAERIIDMFGEDSFAVIESEPERLSEVKGISIARAREISVSFNSQFGMRSVMMFFSDYFGPSLTGKIFKRWGSASVDIVKKNPYILCSDIHGIGFEKADSVARSLGSPTDSSERIEAGIIYTLKQYAILNGDMYIPEEKLCGYVAQLLGVEFERIRECISSMCTRRLLIAFNFDDMTYATDSANSNIYLPVNYHIERSIADKLTLLSKFNSTESFIDINKMISDLEVTEGITYAPSQRNAILSALQNSVYVLTGGPGTGKTTIIRAIIRIYTTLGLSYVLAAPTGRAAKRMTESTMSEAKTIHRLLEFEYSENDDEPNFCRDESNPLKADVVIIDEASMIDANLFFSLLRAIRPGTRLLLIGDASQLPSVGAGNVLKDIISCGAFSVGRLNEIFRQEGGSSIIVNAHNINNGRYPDFSNKSADFFFMQRSVGGDVASTIVQLFDKRLPAKYGPQITDEIQVLCPTKKSECGTINLNKLLQKIKNPESEEKVQIKVRDFILREGDRVMQTKNNYDVTWVKENFWGENEEGLGVFNGDIGTVEKIDIKNEIITIVFDGKTVEYEYSNLEEIEHAYAVTIHKSQGSEYPVVIIPILQVAPLLMTRNLLYTAITRAQRMVILVGSKEVIQQMVDNNTDSRRNTGLAKFLGGNNDNS